MSKRIIFLGPPGSGKGTQAKILAHSMDIPHISTGEILRRAVAEETSLGKKVKDFLEQGDLVPDSLLVDLIRERLNSEDADEGWILDGFPRTIAQANFLEELLQEFQETRKVVFNLEVPEPVLVERLLHRAQEEGRADDTEETIRHRLQVYHDLTEAVIDYYHEHEDHDLYSVNGDRLPEEVAKSLNEIVMVSA
ncbi:adenylate kinase [Spirulina subsalsa FACHB-351]|uniref:Adenylate kinase n=1 Tax=Spirulina subsalsa FACHB-351 TaxID=234711 RepID=A0ABT3L0U8_9CYAN|nr:adenylate kinase [Spirulina subsalsa]MCW6035133.1 adenylate kinase [Spirulina subsalsa FACHB-351]